MITGKGIMNVTRINPNTTSRPGKRNLLNP